MEKKKSTKHLQNTWSPESLHTILSTSFRPHLLGADAEGVRVYNSSELVLIFSVKSELQESTSARLKHYN